MCRKCFFGVQYPFFLAPKMLHTHTYTHTHSHIHTYLITNRARQAHTHTYSFLLRKKSNHRNYTVHQKCCRDIWLVNYLSLYVYSLLFTNRWIFIIFKPSHIIFIREYTSFYRQLDFPSEPGVANVFWKTSLKVA